MNFVQVAYGRKPQATFARGALYRYRRNSSLFQKEDYQVYLGAIVDGKKRLINLREGGFYSADVDPFGGRSQLFEKLPYGTIVTLTVE